MVVVRCASLFLATMCIMLNIRRQAANADSFTELLDCGDNNVLNGPWGNRDTNARPARDSASHPFLSYDTNHWICLGARRHTDRNHRLRCPHVPRQRVVASLSRRAQQLGMRLVPETQTA